MKAFFQKLREKVSGFPYYQKVLFGAIGAIILFLMIIGLIKFGHILAFILVYNWLANKISESSGINAWLIRTIALPLAILVVYAFGLCLSWQERKRRTGIVILTSLALISFLMMFFITKDQFFSRTTGQPIKYYAMTLDGPVISDSPGYDPKYGEKMSVLSAEKAKEIYATIGEIEVAKDREVFFSPHTGEPVKWYYRYNDGKLEIFNQPGFHPKTGQALKPVTLEVVAEYLREKKKTDNLNSSIFQDILERQNRERLAEEEKRVAAQYKITFKVVDASSLSQEYKRGGNRLINGWIWKLKILIDQGRTFEFNFNQSLNLNVTHGQHHWKALLEIISPRDGHVARTAEGIGEFIIDKDEIFYLEIKPCYALFGPLFKIELKK